MMSVIMTETAGADADTRAQARERAEVLGIPYFERQGSLEYMTKLTGTDCFLIYEKNGPVYRAGSSFYRYHIGSAALRLLQLKKQDMTDYAVFCLKHGRCRYWMPLSEWEETLPSYPGFWAVTDG